MPLRNMIPLTFRARGVSDAIDGSNAFPGAMAALANLVHAPSTSNIFVPRAAAEIIYGFFTGSLAANAGGDVLAVNAGGDSLSVGSGGVITVAAVVGTRVYGMISSPLYAGYDQPFCYDLLTNTVINIQGVTATNLPVSPPTVGDWTPPVMNDVTNGRIILTHPGFPGGTTGRYFGWIDISGFSISSLSGNVTSGSNVITSITGDGTSSPIIDGVQPGMTVTGAGIPVGTTVVSLKNGTFSLNTTGNTHGTTTLDGLASTTGVQIGMYVTGPQFAAGTYVTAIPTGSSVTLSVAALGTASGTAVNFSGGGTITLSQPATATANLVALAIAGGIDHAPLWGCGNTNGVPLANVPTSVAQFSGRAYYAVNDTVVFSDVLNPTQVSFSTQALVLDGNTPVTALAGLPLTSQVSGGTIQSLIAFKGAEPFYQITGDAALNNLTLSLVEGSVGTLAPNTICGTPLGIAFVAPDGLRILSLNGTLSEVIGSYGEGVSIPFITTAYPSRMCAAYGQDSIRISVQNSNVSGQPWQEYVLNMKQKTWSGPHTFPSLFIAPYNDGDIGGFVLVPQAAPGTLWFHTLVPRSNSLYVENGNQMSWLWQTCLMPDNEQMRMNQISKTTLGMVLPPGQTVAIVVHDEGGVTLDSTSITNTATGQQATWGGSTWGAFNWGALPGFFKQWRVSWNQPIVFKQMSLLVSGPSSASQAIGNMYLGYQPRGYLLEDAA